jgi:DNA invertase Pin-like site-specific DNA recombinase
MKKIAVYARVSTSDKGQDLETQLIPLREYVEARGWTLFEVYSDVMSGTKEDRPALQRLMNDAQKRRFDVCLVYRFDRFARSTKSLVNALELFRNLGIDFISYQENIDTSSPAGKALFTMVSAFAELEASIISERVKSGLVKARAKGKKLGRPKVNVDTDKIIVLHQKGASNREIAKALSLSKSTVQRKIEEARQSLTSNNLFTKNPSNSVEANRRDYN